MAFQNSSFFSQCFMSFSIRKLLGVPRISGNLGFSVAQCAQFYSVPVLMSTLFSYNFCHSLIDCVVSVTRREC
jgi:hypothetical protein